MQELLLELHFHTHRHTHTFSFSGCESLVVSSASYRGGNKSAIKAAFTGGDDDSEEEDSLPKFGDFCRFQRVTFLRSDQQVTPIRRGRKKIYTTIMEIPRDVTKQSKKKKGFSHRFREQKPHGARKDSRATAQIFNRDRWRRGKTKRFYKKNVFASMFQNR